MTDPHQDSDQDLARRVAYYRRERSRRTWTCIIPGCGATGTQVGTGANRKYCPLCVESWVSLSYQRQRRRKRRGH